MKIAKVTIEKIKCIDDKGREYTLELHTPYELIESLDGEELVQKLGSYYWNGTKISGPRDNIFYIPQIDTKVKKIV